LGRILPWLIQPVSDLLGAIERIGPLIAEHAAAAEADRRLSDAVYHVMYDAGFHGMLAPKAYGGLELHPADCLGLWAAVVRIVCDDRGVRHSPLELT
jgi:3-hydroxy-9,10-secoandrosta-1,3,5(10)-triene-9,17-dione monooxygenase